MVNTIYYFIMQGRILRLLSDVKQYIIKLNVWRHFIHVMGI